MRIEAHRVDIAITIDFDTEDQFQEAAYTCSGSVDAEELLAFLNDMARMAGAQDGLPGRFLAEKATPLSVVNALELAQFDIVLPDNWKDEDDDEVPDPNGTTKQEVM
ncbi:hypothetical protein UXN85_20920 [Enterobacter hormaechei]